MTATLPSSDLANGHPLEVLRELLPPEGRAQAEVLEADLDRGALAVLDADPAVVARPRERAEDAIVVVETSPDDPVLDDLRVAVLRVGGEAAKVLDRPALEIAVGGLHGRDAGQHAVQEFVG